mgnify:CR=1 FL=1
MRGRHVRDHGIERQHLIAAIHHLPERERSMMGMYYEQDMNLKEIGAVLGVIGDFGTDGPVQHGNTARLEEREVEALLIQKALTRFSGNVSKAAEALGLSRGLAKNCMMKKMPADMQIQPRT